MQDHLGAIRRKGYAPGLQFMDNLLVFLWENQGVWVAATERTGDDPLRVEPVWITGASTRGTSIGHLTFWLTISSWCAERQMKLTAMTGTLAKMRRARGS